MSIHAVSQHLGIRWETVKNIDREYLRSSLPALEPEKLKNLLHIGVDEVARAKRHDYMTVVYDLVSGHLIWVEHGRKAEVLISLHIPAGSEHLFRKHLNTCSGII
jgi:transposase